MRPPQESAGGLGITNRRRCLDIEHRVQVQRVGAVGEGFLDCRSRRSRSTAAGNTRRFSNQVTLTGPVSTAIPRATSTTQLIGQTRKTTQ